MKSERNLLEIIDKGKIIAINIANTIKLRNTNSIVNSDTILFRLPSRVAAFPVKPILFTTSLTEELSLLVRRSSMSLKKRYFWIPFTEYETNDTFVPLVFVK